jgi:hypothetical protein
MHLLPVYHRPAGRAEIRRQRMTAAREYDSVRTVTGVTGVTGVTDVTGDDGRAIPAGLRGAVLDARPDGSCLAEFAFEPQTADTDGDFVRAVLTPGQYEVIRAQSSA